MVPLERLADVLEEQERDEDNISSIAAVLVTPGVLTGMMPIHEQQTFSWQAIKQPYSAEKASQL